MKRLFTVLVVFALGVGVGRLLEEKAPVAEAGQEPGCAPLLVTGGGVVIQDMNGDGAFDPITEAVRLLSWAFLGAPAPVAPCAGGGPSGLPDTGQTKCFDQSGAEIPCDDATCRGQDGFYPTGCPIDGTDGSGRFVVNNGGTPEDTTDDTVTDTCTGLTWQKETAPGRYSWCAALAYCENLSFAGQDDWRLPNVRELQSIVDYGRFPPAIDPHFGAFLGFYWSSTSVGTNPDRAWIVSFSSGDVYDDKVGSNYVRAVRSGP